MGIYFLRILLPFLSSILFLISLSILLLFHLLFYLQFYLQPILSSTFYFSFYYYLFWIIVALIMRHVCWGDSFLPIASDRSTRPSRVGNMKGCRQLLRLL